MTKCSHSELLQSSGKMKTNFLHSYLFHKIFQRRSLSLSRLQDMKSWANTFGTSWKISFCQTVAWTACEHTIWSPECPVLSLVCWQDPSQMAKQDPFQALQQLRISVAKHLQYCSFLLSLYSYSFPLTFRCQIKSRLPFAGIIRRLFYTFSG